MESIQKMVYELGQILFALPQRGQENGDQVNAVIKILTHLLLFHPLPQVPVGGGNDPKIGFHQFVPPTGVYPRPQWPAGA